MTILWSLVKRMISIDYTHACYPPFYLPWMPFESELMENISHLDDRRLNGEFALSSYRLIVILIALISSASIFLAIRFITEQNINIF